MATPTPMRKSTVAALVLALFLLAAGSARAHWPVLEEKDTRDFASAITINDATVSQAIYGHLETADDIDFYRLQVKGPLTLEVNLLLPYESSYESFYPLFAVAGPGIQSHDSVPFELPAGAGVRVIRSPPVSPRPRMFEPFSWMYYYEGMQPFREEVSAPGDYYLMVWSPTGEYGDYLISLGGSEKWGPGDFSVAMKLVGKIKRNWGQVPLRKSEAPAR